MKNFWKYNTIVPFYSLTALIICLFHHNNIGYIINAILFVGNLWVANYIYKLWNKDEME